VITYNNEISWNIIWNISAFGNKILLLKFLPKNLFRRLTKIDVRIFVNRMSVVMAGRVCDPHKNNCRAGEDNEGGVRYTHRHKYHATLVLKLLGYNIAFKHK
jgi:hypothetical protein